MKPEPLKGKINIEGNCYRKDIAAAVEFLREKDEIAIKVFIRILGVIKNKELIEEFQRFRVQLGLNKHEAFKDVNLSLRKKALGKKKWDWSKDY